MLAQYTIYDFLWFFTIYSFLGWCAEVAFAALCDGIFVNRGFLNGPFCPIYGFGVVIVLAVLTPLMENKIVLFFGSVLLTSTLEWITGFILEKIFHDKWWDYSDDPFNLNGYICLKFSILWGLACVFIVEIFHPTIMKLIALIPHFIGWMIIGIFLTIFLADTIVTAASILKLNRRLEQMDEIAMKLKEASNRIGESISENVSELVEKSGEIKERTEVWQEEQAGKWSHIQEEWERKQFELKTQIEELKTKYEDLAGKKKFIHKRVMKAFPKMKSNRYAEAFEELKKRYGL